MNQKINYPYSFFGFRHAGGGRRQSDHTFIRPIAVQQADPADSLNVNGKPFDLKSLVKSTIPSTAPEQCGVIEQIPPTDHRPAPEKGYACTSILLPEQRRTESSLESPDRHIRSVS